MLSSNGQDLVMRRRKKPSSSSSSSSSSSTLKTPKRKCQTPFQKREAFKTPASKRLRRRALGDITNTATKPKRPVRMSKASPIGEKQQLKPSSLAFSGLQLQFANASPVLPLPHPSSSLSEQSFGQNSEQKGKEFVLQDLINDYLNEEDAEEPEIEFCYPLYPISSTSSDESDEIFDRSLIQTTAPDQQPCDYGKLENSYLQIQPEEKVEMFSKFDEESFGSNSDIELHFSEVNIELALEEEVSSDNFSDADGH